jgi:hypothetical protein
MIHLSRAFAPMEHACEWEPEWERERECEEEFS